MIMLRQNQALTSEITTPTWQQLKSDRQHIISKTYGIKQNSSAKSSTIRKHNTVIIIKHKRTTNSKQYEDRTEKLNRNTQRTTGGYVEPAEENKCGHVTNVILRGKSQKT